MYSAPSGDGLLYCTHSPASLVTRTVQTDSFRLREILVASAYKVPDRVGPNHIVVPSACHPISALWQVTRSMRPVRVSGISFDQETRRVDPQCLG